VPNRLKQEETPKWGGLRTSQNTKIRKRKRERNLNGLNRRLVQAIQVLSNLKLLP